ncbi:UDP-2,4-diacetamido-2,4,6-trideoxy-beta-L-altropyranose hydrolase [Asticcacaulis sp. 201]|uniref:UDP-2,4-diacetamido-2,4, 6-trideoxy-beta-L-altropyranose hydrolase n=1 Tax=Asticcacaulis sp. 201 TaxID=3028787 RepID=UPI0029161C83|nr:UDP-2,4-diacetamido-2,4,6-trideoxy-beta-L-altropyranose hydrolase [Asticcacaulis sp. 201]MDV6331668.1 UDP-2,4-diacetamido-2,4,6-trideoxy-beta-L-altropyranose hydrolase [Asticcacaulis sp. 201]
MRLLIRTEASPQIGMGHFMRCFAIAETARTHDIPVTFLLNEVGDAVLARLHDIGAEGVAVCGSPGSAADFMAMGALNLSRDRDWLLIDSYQVTEDYLTLQTPAARVAVIDDMNALARYDCDLIINPAQAARRIDYERKTSARLCLGPDYALIRKEFLQHSDDAYDGGFIAILFGGSDPLQLSGRCARLLRETLPDTPIRIIAGPANIHSADLMALEQELNAVSVVQSPASVAQALCGASLVLTAAGGSVGEIAAMGLPALVLVVYDNQASALKACPYPVIDARTGLPEGLGSEIKKLINDPARRADIAQHAHAVVDGNGPQRIVEVMKNV